LQQAQHGVRSFQIPRNLLRHPALGGGQFEGQSRQQFCAQMPISAEYRGLNPLLPVSETTQTELVGHQLFEHQSVQGGMATVVQVRQRGRGRGSVEQTQGCGQGWKPESLQDLLRHHSSGLASS